YEVGAKWQLNNNLFASLAFYQLERERMQITDPSNVNNKIIVDGQRTRGMEININGRVTDKYSVVGGINLTDAEITKDQATTGGNLISKGTALGNVANVSFSLWNLYDIDDRWSLALGAIGRGEMYAATPTVNTSVTIPGWIRFDAGAYAKIDDKTKLQFNIENILDKTYYSAAHNVNNIMVGMPFNAKATLIRDF
ncbi:MAG: TonB-dependent receptor domain-containing protein, partial [Methylophilaceae bacterium]